MGERKKLKLPDAKPSTKGPVFTFGSPAGAPYVHGLRDVSKPLFYDEAGNPVYGPRGFVFRLW